MSPESSSSSEISEQLKQMRDPNTINSEMQEKVWHTEASKRDKMNLIDRRQGVNGLKKFHSWEIKWFKEVMKQAFSMIKVTKEQYDELNVVIDEDERR